MPSQYCRVTVKMGLGIQLGNTRKPDHLSDDIFRRVGETVAHMVRRGNHRSMSPKFRTPVAGGSVFIHHIHDTSVDGPAAIAFPICPNCLVLVIARSVEARVAFRSVDPGSQTFIANQ